MKSVWHFKTRFECGSPERKQTRSEAEHLFRCLNMYNISYRNYQNYFNLVVYQLSATSTIESTFLREFNFRKQTIINLFFKVIVNFKLIIQKVQLTTIYMLTMVCSQTQNISFRALFSSIFRLYCCYKGVCLCVCVV